MTVVRLLSRGKEKGARGGWNRQPSLMAAGSISRTLGEAWERICRHQGGNDETDEGSERVQMPQTQRVDFVSVIAELKNGRALNDCSRKLTELVDAVAEHAKKGKLTLQLVVELGFVA